MLTVKIVDGFYNALIFRTLRRGKQLQLWDSNVHKITTWSSQPAQVPAEYHN